MKNYLEKKERRTRFTRATIIIILVLVLINYVFLYLGRMYKFTPGLIGFGVMDVLFLWRYSKEIGIKFPKRKSPEWLIKELETLEKKYVSVYKEISNSEELSVRNKNESCPMCGGKKIVDKIRQVKGTISGSFTLGFGSVNGENDTKPVNSCNDCGHEWKKGETSYLEQIECTMNSILKPMYLFFNDNQDNTSDELKKFRARSVLIFIKEHENGYRAKELRKLSERDLKKYGCS